jgi:hypothetical protein
MLDDQVLFKTGEDGDRNTYNFLQQQNAELEKDLKNSSDAFFLPIDDFKNKRTGEVAKTPRLPYETIDVNLYLNQLIFNRNNVYANKQYHDPSNIKYNVYDK